MDFKSNSDHRGLNENNNKKFPLIDNEEKENLNKKK